MIDIKLLNSKEITKAMELKVDCWTEELAGKAENTLSVDSQIEFINKWLETDEENSDIRLVVGAYDDKDELLGFAGASIAEVEDIKDKGIELNYLFVDEKHRGRGVSLKLIKYILDYFTEKGFEEIVIYNHHYAPSNEYYRKFGAEVMRQDLQMKGKLLVDVFKADIKEYKENVEKMLDKY